MVTHTTNPTRILDIPQTSVGVQITRNKLGELESIQVQRIDDDVLQSLPATSRVWLIAKAKFSEIEVDLGTINKLDLPKNISLGELDRTRPLHIRIFAFDPTTKRILASIERLSTYDAEEGSLQSLLPVEPVDLGERAWRLLAENDARPILQVSNDPTLGLLERLKTEPLVQALILPAALEQVFQHLQECEADGDDAEEWKRRWVRFLESIDFPLPEPSDDGPDKEWPKLAADTACQHLKLKSRAVNSLEDSEP